ncbi:E3 ubiquitin-protein ligase ATL4-like [Malus sylvestris]|uniref:E3 ubiquitin-protein ligase ATL4-like n=1 Tax=Malus sylvestris TaxID=3752 RepID=UPI0021AC7BE2|nr:E3 ubiquitin-protein ligase ATL4-like [Malus sylvestris]
MSETTAASPAPSPPLLPHRKSSSFFKNLSPNLLIIIVILAATLVASICLILRHLNSRCIRRLAPSPSDSFSDSRRISTRRINPDTSPSLPLYTFSSIARRSSSTISADCAVCLSKFEPSDEVHLLPLCCHTFHSACIDPWLQSQQTCPLCRSSIAASDAELMMLVSSNAEPATANGSGRFRLEIGNVSLRNNNQTTTTNSPNRHSYSVGSFDYSADEETSEVRLSNAEREKDEVVLVVAEPEPSIPPSILAAEVGSGRSSWLKDYIDQLSSTLSSRDMSFRSSGRFYTGSSCRSEVSIAGDSSLETERVGEEISEMFRWLAGV